MISPRRPIALLPGAVCLLLACATTVGPPAPLRGQVGLEREVTSLEFSGNRAFSDDRLASAIVLDETSCKTFAFAPFCWLTDWGLFHSRAYLDESVLPADLLRLRLFYRRRGYRAVAVDTAVERLDGEVRVRFEIDEGPPTVLDTLVLAGLEGTLAPASVRERFPLEPGEPFDLVELSAAKEEIADRLRNRGYPRAAVLDEYFIPRGSRSVELTLDVRPGPLSRFGDVRVEGAGAVGEEVVRQVLSFRSGQLYRQERVLQSQRDLYRLEAIRFANVQTSPSEAADTLVDVTVSVTPAPPRTVRTGVGVTTTDCVQTEARFTHRNFLGGARSLRVTGRLSNLLADQLGESFPCTGVGRDPVFRELGYTLRADFREPFFLSSGNSLEASLFLERESVPDIFVRQSRGGELAVTRRLRPRMPVSIGFRPELTSFDEQSADVFFCVNFGFCQPDDIDALTRSRWLAPLRASWSYDRTDAAFSPTAGYYLDVNTEWADRVTGSDYQYVRFNIEAADFEELAEGLVLAVRIRTGFVEALGGQPFGDPDPAEGGVVVHPRKRFFVGGAQSVRGFEQNLLGPTVLLFQAADCPDSFGTSREELTECALELASRPTDPNDVFDERPVGGDAAFEGNIELRAHVSGPWTVVGFVDVGQVWVDIGQLEAPVASPGAGVRFESPVGPLRVDVGYDPTSPDRLPAVAELPSQEIVELRRAVPFDQFTYDGRTGFREFWRRLHLNISIGEAF